MSGEIHHHYSEGKSTTTFSQSRQRSAFLQQTLSSRSEAFIDELSHDSTDAEYFQKMPKRRNVNPNHFPGRLRRIIKEEQGNKCAVLNTVGPLEVHHKIPKSHGGLGTQENGVAVAPEVHDFLDKMALNHKIYYDEIMEIGKEYIIGYLNATPGVQEAIIKGDQSDATLLSDPHKSGYDIAAGD